MAATVQTGNENSYTAAVTVVRQLETHLDMFESKDFPLLKRVGLNSYGETVYNTKVEWQRDWMVPLEDVLAAAITSTSETQLTCTYAEYFNLHDVVLLDSELVQVLAIDPTNNYLTVSRGFAGSTAATHLISITMYKLGSARPEGSSPGWAQQVTVNAPYNYTRIWDVTVGITGTEEALKNYAPDDLLAYRMDKRMAELYQMMERSLLYSNQRYVGTAALGRLSAGLDYFVYDKNNLADASFGFGDVEDAIQDKFSAFGATNLPDSLWVNAWLRRRISAWGVGTIRTDRTENVVGNQIDVIDTNFGTISVNLDHLILPSHAWLLNMDTIMCAPLNGRGFKEIDASVQGDDATRRRALGEYVWIIKGEDAATNGLNVKIYGASTTS